MMRLIVGKPPFACQRKLLRRVASNSHVTDPIRRLTLTGCGSDFLRKVNSMKTSLLFLPLALFTASLVAQTTPVTNAPAQSQQADLRREIPGLTTEQLVSLVNLQTSTAGRILGLNLQADGALPQLLRARNPIHILNPFAPASYGNGFDNLSYDPRTRRGEGIAFLRIKF